MNQPIKNGMLVAALVLSTHATGQITREEFVEALPVFTSGPHTGKHAVYQHEKFTAWFDAKGILLVQTLDKGKPVGKPFSCLAVEPYYVAKGTHWPRAMKRFQDTTPPVVIPAGGGKIYLRGRLEDNVPFKAEYTFSGNTIKAAGGCQDPPAIRPPTYFRLLTRFARTHNLPATTPVSELEPLMRGMTVEVLPVASGLSAESHPYSKSIRSLSGPYTAMVTRGAFGPRVITHKPIGKEGHLHGYIYTGFKAWQGYCAQYITQGKKINVAHNEAMAVID